jgi:CheY-like chemotaxis protein/Tfp pilus assembly protein PilZ
VSYSTIDALVVEFTRDVCRGGVFLLADRLMPVGTTVGLDMALPDDGGSVHFTCKVAFTRDAESAEILGKPMGMGLQFLDLDLRQLETIERFIADRAVFAQPSSAKIAVGPRDVLVVDDEATARELLAACFRSRGDNVRTASDGLQALAMALKKAPDVIVTDVHMPRLDGWHLLRMIRSRPSLEHVPVVFLTQFENEGERLLSYQIGVDDYVGKPFNSEELRARVDRVLARTKSSPTGARERQMLRGELEHVSVVSVLVFLDLERKTGELSLLGDGKSGSIFVKNGSPVRAEFDGHAIGATARDRLFALLSWTSGHFEFTKLDVDDRDDIQMSTTQALLDHAQRTDEAAR